MQIYDHWEFWVYHYLLICYCKFLLFYSAIRNVKQLFQARVVIDFRKFARIDDLYTIPDYSGRQKN